MSRTKSHTPGRRRPPPPCSAPGPPVPPNSAFSSPPTPPLPPRQKLPITQWNRPADFFAPRNEREGPQTRWMRVAGCCEWRVRKCACACRRGGGRLTINLDNPIAASDASSGRESARGARNSGSSPPRYSAFCQTQEGVSVSANWGGEDPRGTKNLPAKCKAVHEIVRSENRHVQRQIADSAAFVVACLVLSTCSLRYPGQSIGGVVQVAGVEGGVR